MTDRRNFPRNVKAQIIHRAMNSAGRACCEGCGGVLKRGAFEIDHIVAEALVIDKSAPLTAKDGQLLGACCHRGENGKTAKDVTAIAKCKRAEFKHLGIRKARTFPKPPPGYRYDWKRRTHVKETV